jgi:endonuclease YncB( thermonuclease family)
MPHASNDGDSFRVHCPEKEFIVRLYFVDAPETNLRCPDRAREQAEYLAPHSTRA